MLYRSCSLLHLLRKNLNTCNKSDFCNLFPVGFSKRQKSTLITQKFIHVLPRSTGHNAETRWRFLSKDTKNPKQEKKESKIDSALKDKVVKLNEQNLGQQLKKLSTAESPNTPDNSTLSKVIVDKRKKTAEEIAKKG